MKILSLFDLQQVTATGGGPELDLTNYAKNLKFAYAGANTAGSTPTLASKIQASPALARGLEQSTAGATDNKLRSGASTNTKLSLKFTQSGARQVKRVAIMLKNPGTITAGKILTLTINTDSAGSPSNTAVTNGTSANVLCSAVGAAYAWVVFTFANPVDLADATVYHLVLSGDYTADTTNCVYWRSLTVGSGGTVETSTDGTTWAAVTATQSFEAYVDQFNFADVTGGAFTGLTTGASMAPAEKNFDLRTIGNPVLRLYNAIGGTSSPAYYAGCAIVAQAIQQP